MSTYKVKPGLDDLLGEDTKTLELYLHQLMDGTREMLKKELHATTPLYLMATGGEEQSIERHQTRTNSNTYTLTHTHIHTATHTDTQIHQHTQIRHLIKKELHETTTKLYLKATGGED